MDQDQTIGCMVGPEEVAQDQGQSNTDPQDPWCFPNHHWSFLFFVRRIGNRSRLLHASISTLDAAPTSGVYPHLDRRRSELPPDLTMTKLTGGSISAAPWAGRTSNLCNKGVRPGSDPKQATRYARRQSRATRHEEVAASEPLERHRGRARATWLADCSPKEAEEKTNYGRSILKGG